MKKYLSAIMIFILVLALTPIRVNAATNAANISVSNTNPAIDSITTVTVNFTNPVGTARFTLNYDSSRFQYVSSNLNSSEVSNTGNSLAVTYIRNDAATIKSASFSFKAKSLGTGNFSVSVSKLSDAEGNIYQASAGSAKSATVKEKPKETTNNNSSNNNNNNSNSGNKSSGNTSNRKKQQNIQKNEEENTEETENEVEENKVEENKIDDELASLNLEPLEDDEDENQNDKKEESQIVKFFKKFIDPENYTVPNIISIICTVIMLIVGIVQAILLRKLSQKGNGKRYE